MKPGKWAQYDQSRMNNKKKTIKSLQKKIKE